jgi:prepilin-type N-terminal cleavage/methylation domain-containing protein
MTIAPAIRRNRRPAHQAFTLVEVMVSVVIISIMFVSLYAGISSGFGVLNAARENLRATQLMLEKMETIRLYSWDQINTPGFMPATFTTPFYPNDTNSSLNFYGRVVVTNAPVSTNYAAQMRLVIFNVKWTNGTVVREREMQTFVSQNGLQNYVY